MPKFKDSRNANEEKIQEVWKAFLEQYPDEASVIENLFAKEGLFCYRCGHRLAEPSDKPRLYICPNCRKRVWPTSKTFLKKKKKPRAWLAGIFFKEHSVGIGAPRLAKLLDIAPSSATTILRVLRVIMNDYLSTSSSKVYSGLFLSIFTRRSKESPRKAKPNAEQEAYEEELEEKAQNNTWTTVEDVTPPKASATNEDTERETLTISATTEVWETIDNEELTELETTVYSALSTKPQHLDNLCQTTGIATSQLMAILTLLELKGLIQNLGGNLYRISKAAQPPSVPIEHSDQQTNSTGLPLHIRRLIEDFQLFVRQIFHGISRKYLQLYLAEYWTQLTDRWKNGGLLKICLSRGRLVQTKEISPTYLRVMLPHPDQALLAQSAL